MVDDKGIFFLAFFQSFFLSHFSGYFHMILQVAPRNDTNPDNAVAVDLLLFSNAVYYSLLSHSISHYHRTAMSTPMSLPMASAPAVRAFPPLMLSPSATTGLRMVTTGLRAAS